MSQEQTMVVPDLGGVSKVDVIEILVRPGDTIQVDTPILTLESEKASMEIPSTFSGTVQSLLVKIGDKVSTGSPVLTIMVAEVSQPTVPQPAAPMIEQAPEVPPTVLTPTPVVEQEKGAGGIYAGPAVRRLARELGIELTTVSGTGLKSRITREDMMRHIKGRMQSGGGMPMMSAAPEIDFSEFGPIEQKPLSKIKRLTAQQVHRSWITIPHVTQFDEADITALEAFRRGQAKKLEKEGAVYKLTPLAFIVKAVTKILALYPSFNASLDPTGEQLIYKQYYHIGIAVETPGGLVVPVIRNADQLSIAEIAKEMHRLSVKAREKGLMPADMRGGTFTVSSLGGISGVGFTPIVNHPEVAILGVSRSAMKPVYDGETFVPKLILPFSLSYDHRVIDGAEAARFTRDLSAFLSDIRLLLL